MKRVLLISLMIFLLFGMLLQTPIVFADENNNSGSSNNSEDDACEEISDETFRSIEQYENGLGVYENNSSTFLMRGYWRISFKNGEFSWQVSDTVQVGPYVCDGKSIVGPIINGRKLVGEYNVDKDILTWDGKEYIGNQDENETENDNDEDENETEDDEDKDNKDRIKIKSRKIITRDNCTIKIERKLKTEGGKAVEVVTKKMVCADGTREEVKIRIENRTDDGRIRERIKYEFKGKEMEVETEEGIELEEDKIGRAHV